MKHHNTWDTHRHLQKLLSFLNLQHIWSWHLLQVRGQCCDGWVLGGATWSPRKITWRRWAYVANHQITIRLRWNFAPSLLNLPQKGLLLILLASMINGRSRHSQDFVLGAQICQPTISFNVNFSEQFMGSLSRLEVVRWQCQITPCLRWTWHRTNEWCSTSSSCTQSECYMPNT